MRRKKYIGIEERKAIFRKANAHKINAIFRCTFCNGWIGLVNIESHKACWRKHDEAYFKFESIKKALKKKV